MKPVKSLNVKESIVALKVLDDGHFSIMDANTSLRIINLQDYHVVGGLKSNITQERQMGQIMCTSSDGRFCSAIIPSTNKVALFSIAKKGLLYKVGRHQGKVESVCIDPKSRYVVTGGEDGKTFVWTLKNARLAFSLPPHCDFVTALSFSPSGQFLASGSFDKSINVFNIATMKSIKPLKAHATVVTQIIFLNEQRLVSADKEGGVIVWDLSNSTVIKRLSKVPDDITAMCVSSDFQFLFVGTKLGYVLLYDLRSYELLSNRYIKIDATVSALAFIEEDYRLGIGTLDGLVLFYSLFGDTTIYEAYLKNREYKLLYQAFENNPILRYSELFAKAEALWEKSIHKATQLLEAHDKKNALALLSAYKEIPKKNTTIQSLLNDFEFYIQFEKCINEKRYPLAYSLALKYPSFQESEKYKSLERQFHKALIKSQELLSKAGGETLARELIAPYRGVSEKTKVIQELFNEHKALNYLKQLIAKKEFKNAYILIQQHEFLKEFPEYETLDMMGDKIYIQAYKSYEEGNYKKATTFAQMLLDFPMFQDEAKELLSELQAKQQFYTAVGADETAKSYKLMSMYPILYETKEGEALEMQWNKDVEAASVYANKGDITNVTKILENYFNIEAKYIALATVYQQAYIEQLTQLLREKGEQDKIETGIRNYLHDFGLNEFIALFFESFSASYPTKIDLQSQVAGDIVLWKPSMISPYIYMARS